MNAEAPEIGVFPGAVVPVVSRRVGADRAMFWAMTGVSLPAADALSVGLVDEVVATDIVHHRVQDVAALYEDQTTNVLHAGLRLRRRLSEARGLAEARDTGRLVGALYWGRDDLQRRVADDVRRSQDARTRD